MRKIAVLGSRKWSDLQAVALKINALYTEHGAFILVSGGADGPSMTAEATAMQFGLPVISFRPVKLPDFGFDQQYAVNEWRLYHGKGDIVMHDKPSWANIDSALAFRSMLIAERADEGVAFWDGYSRGTGSEIDFFGMEGKPLEVVKS